jgi:hypothetical protein
MNAILRYVGESKSKGEDSVANKHTKETASKSSLTSDPELTHVTDHPVLTLLIILSKSKLPLWRMVLQKNNNDNEFGDQLPDKKLSVGEKVDIAEHPINSS